MLEYNLVWEEVESSDKSMVEKEFHLKMEELEEPLCILQYCGEELGWVVNIDKKDEFIDSTSEEEAKEEAIDNLICHRYEKIEESKIILECLGEEINEETSEEVKGARIKEINFSKEDMEKAILHFKYMKNEADIILKSGYGRKPGESIETYRNRKLCAEIAVAAIEAQFRKE